MKIKLERVGPHTCLPLPAQAAAAAGFAPGDHVDVTWDGSRAQLVVRPRAESLANRRLDSGDVDLGRALDEFLEQYSDSLTELAADDHALPDRG